MLMLLGLWTTGFPDSPPDRSTGKRLWTNPGKSLKGHGGMKKIIIKQILVSESLDAQSTGECCPLPGHNHFSRAA
jgi:hypothetical protein